ncbi:hypothetical protein ACHQM5_000513 [Ranunculus cassubicifolius]
MAMKNPKLALILNLITLLLYLSIKISAENELGFNLHYSETLLKPYNWRYIRVDLPLGFASMSLNVKSNVNIDARTLSKLPKRKLPVICFRIGSPPLPDASKPSLTVLSSPTNGSIVDIQALHLVEQCHPLQEDITLALTNDQISSGVWYIGIFNGYGPESTQGKMIVRGSDVSFSANLSVEECPTSAMLGRYCNQTIVPLTCADSDVYTNTTNYFKADVYNLTAERVTRCRISSEASCAMHKAPRGYSLDVIGMAEQLKIMAANVSLTERPINSKGNISGFLYARYGAVPSGSLYDYYSDISKSPLVIQSPKVGRWYVSLLPGEPSKGRTMKGEEVTSDLCYSLDWELQKCPVGKAGLNCSCQSYDLETVIAKGPSVPFESYYWPISEEISRGVSNFLLEPLLTNSSLGGTSKYAWTYFLLDIPRGAAGGNLHVRLNSDAKLDYEIYCRFGGLPSLDTWDYYYANKTSSSDGSIFFKLYDSSENTVNFYILYAKEGTWSFGLRHPTGISNERHTTMSISSERCPHGCSSHGACQSALDASGLTLYSYCFCDRDHGGFDCSIEVVSHTGHIIQSIALIASNLAAILPAFWTLRQKAFAEWVLFTSSGISSGLYHACDVGTWCALSFHTLQFMDFWLSFMAVVSTFVYLPNIGDVTKRVIHTAVAILTALLAVSGATRSSNIIIVIAIGALGLIVGWLVESSSTIRSLSFSTMSRLDLQERWQHIKARVYNFFKTLRSRFRWWFIFFGFAFLFLAGLSWKLETDKTYWIWHSIWHVSIYTSSFFFLCSKVTPVDSNTQEGPPVAYELTRQDSMPRI